MKITEDEVRYVAGLAHLHLTGEEVHRLRRDLDEILTHVEKLQELDTAQVEPMAQVLYEVADETATLRQRALERCLNQETALANAPRSGAGHFKVPKVIER